jgi:hypothetical protein
VKSGQAHYAAGSGTVEFVFAMNKWVRIRLPSGDSVQRQVGNPRELAVILRQLGLTEAESSEAAQAAWEERPASAGLPEARARQSLRSAAGVPSWVLVLILAAFVVIALYALAR